MATIAIVATIIIGMTTPRSGSPSFSAVKLMTTKMSTVTGVTTATIGSKTTATGTTNIILGIKTAPMARVTQTPITTTTSAKTTATMTGIATAMNGENTTTTISAPAIIRPERATPTNTTNLILKTTL